MGNNTSTALSKKIESSAGAVYETKNPTFKSILDELKSRPITEDLLEDLFKKCCFMSVDTFLDTHKSEDTLKCQSESRNAFEWYFTCLTCSHSESSCFCLKCFFNGNHQDHKFNLFESQSAVCDCGNPEAIKKEGFCTTHQNVNEKSQIDRYKQLPAYVQKDIHLFFRYLFAYLRLNSNASSIDNQANMENVSIIVEWVTFIASKSSILIHVIAEEIASQTLDHATFSINNPQPLKHTSNEALLLESRHFLAFLFRHPALINKFLDLFTLLIDNHRPFKTLFFEEYLKNYVDLFTPRDSKSADFMTLIGSFYQNEHTLLPYSTGYSKNNYMDLVLKTHKQFMPILEPFYKSDKKIDKEVILQSDFPNFVGLMKHKEAVEFLLANESIYKQLFEFAGALHKFTSPQFIDPTITTTIFLVKKEHELMASLKNIIHTFPEKRETIAKSLIDHVMDQIKKIEYPKLHSRNGFLLPHADFFQMFKFNEIPVHFPLYRMLATILMTGNEDQIPYVMKKLTITDAVNMMTSILLFRICYISYDPSNDPNKPLKENDFCTDSTIIVDLFCLQLALIFLKPRNFLYAFFNVVTSVDMYNKTTAFNEIFSILISVLQLRGTLEPTEEQMEFHISQALITGYFKSLENFKSFSSTFTVSVDTIEKVLAKCATPDKKIKEDYYQYFDPYYQIYSLKYKSHFKTLSLDKFKLHLDSKKIPEHFPLPPTLTPLVNNFAPINSIFEDPTLMELVFCILLDKSHSTFIGYDDSFDLQMTMKLLIPNTDIVANDFIYMSVLGMRVFMKEVYPGMSDDQKASLKETVKQFLEAENKVGFKFPSTNIIFNLIKTYRVQMKTDQYEPLSVLDLLFELWLSMKDSNNLEKKESISYILNSLIEFDPSFEGFFTSKGVSLNFTEEIEKEQAAKKKEAQEKREKFLQQMRQQQQSFLAQQENQILLKEIEDKEGNSDDDDDRSDDEEVLEEKEEEKEKEKEVLIDQVKLDENNNNNNNIDNNNNNNDVEKSEVIAIKVEESMTPGTPTTPVIKVVEQPDDDIASADNTPKLPTPGTPQHGAHHHHHKETKEKEKDGKHSNQLEPCIVCKQGHQTDPLFAIGYIDIVSTIHQNQNQEIDRVLTDPNVNERYKTFLEEFYDSEICPGSLPFLPDRNDSPTLFAMFLFLRSSSTYVSSCHHNIHYSCLLKCHPKYEEGFACPLCSHPSNLVIPLNINSSSQFAKDRNVFFGTLCKFDFFLFMTADNYHIIERYMFKFVLQNIETLEMKSRKLSLYSEDRSTYYAMKQAEFAKELLTLKRLYEVVMTCDVPDSDSAYPISDPYIYLMDTFAASSYSLYIANKEPLQFAISGYTLYVFKMLVYHFMMNAPVPGQDLTVAYLTECFTKIKSSPIPEQLLAKFKKQIFPLLRKILLLKSFFTQSDLTLDQFADFDHVVTGLEIKPLQEFINTMDWSSLIEEYATVTTTPKGYPFYGVYPPPTSIDYVPEFIDLPEHHIDFIREHIGGKCDKCSKLLKGVCLFCGLKFCYTDNCKGSSYIHSYRCPNTPFGTFLGFEKPSVEVLKEEHGKTCSSLPHTIYLDDNGEPSQTTNTQSKLCKKKLKILYKHWINSNNSRKFAQGDKDDE